MKLHAFISAVLLGTMALAQAQAKPVPQAPKAGVVKNPSMNADGSVTLSAGPLKDVVAEIDRRIQYWMETDGGKDWVMPNIVYGPGTQEALVPTDMRLRQVSPVQALALVAAAAGCSLESIFAPAEKTGENDAFGGSSKPLPIIGYRILLAFVPTRHPKLALAEEAGPLVGIGIALGTKDGGVVVQEVIPGSPASLSPVIQPGDRILSVAEAGKQDLDVSGLGLQNVVQLIRGPPGTTVKITFGADTANGPTQHVASLVRARLPVSSQGTANPQVKLVGLPSWYDDLGNLNLPAPVSSEDATSRAPAQNNAPYVRVFALGSVISGSASEINEKEKNLLKLVEEALEIGGIATQTRRLSFHTQSRALIFMGTAREHAIIEQVIKALKENETPLAAPARR